MAHPFSHGHIPASNKGKIIGSESNGLRQIAETGPAASPPTPRVGWRWGGSRGRGYPGPGLSAASRRQGRVRWPDVMKVGGWALSPQGKVQRGLCCSQRLLFWLSSLHAPLLFASVTVSWVLLWWCLTLQERKGQSSCEGQPRQRRGPRSHLGPS